MPLSEPNHDLSVRALAFGELLLIAIDGVSVSDFDGLLVKQGRQVLAKLGADELSVRIWIGIPDGSAGLGSSDGQLHKVARAMFVPDTSCVLIVSAGAEGQSLSITRTRGGASAGSALIFTPRIVRTILGAPVGNILTLFSLDRGAQDVAALPKPAIDGRPLILVGSRQADHFTCHDYRLPADLYDGESHMVTLVPATGDGECILTRWQCAPSHVRSDFEGPLRSRLWPIGFPDHEIARVASFAADPERHIVPIDPAGLDAWLSSPGAVGPAPIRLFVFDLTLRGALATQAVAQLQDRHPERLEATILLPASEAAAFAQETNRGSAVSQFVDILAVADLSARLSDLPDDAVIVMLAGGNMLMPAGLDEIDAVIAGTSTGAAGAIMRRATAGAFALDVAEDADASLDLSQGAAIFSKHAALRQIALFHQPHEGAHIPLARLLEPQSKTLAGTPPVAVGRQNGYRFGCIVDAQAKSNKGDLIKALAVLSAASIPATVIAPPDVAAKISGNAKLPGIEALVSLSCDVVPERVASLLGPQRASVIHIPADTLALAANDACGFLDLLEFAVGHTAISSTCRLSSGAGETSHGFRCTRNSY